MYNLAISLAAALAAYLLVYFGFHLAWTSAVPAAMLAVAGVYFLLARHTLKQVEAIFVAAQKDFNPKRPDPAIAKMKEAFKLARWQFLVGSQAHAQVGSVLYVLQRDDEAKPHLEKSFVRIGQARAMLGAMLYREKDYPGMEKVFEEAVSYNKKDGLLWSTYAWCLEKSGQREKALTVILRALTESPTDEKMKANQLALQNRERLKMKAYGQEWWALRLEDPPIDAVPAHMRGQLTQRKGYRQKPQQR